MIHIDLQPEPAGFDDTVRRPGLDALASGMSEPPPYWRRCLDDLRAAYQGICAYLCVYIPHGTGAHSVDHFAPKSKHRALIYEWSNYRLVCSLMNARKQAFDDVLDPFEIPDGLFVMEFSFFQVAPAPELPAALKAAVENTISRLKLNDEECRKARGQYYDDYLAGEITLAHVRRRSPFVAREMLRQNLVRQENSYALFS